MNRDLRKTPASAAGHPLLVEPVVILPRQTIMSSHIYVSSLPEITPPFLALPLLLLAYVLLPSDAPLLTAHPLGVCHVCWRESARTALLGGIRSTPLLLPR